MRSLRTKLILIMVLLIMALMAVIGSFLVNGVGNYYIDEFYSQMQRTFSLDFIAQLQELNEDETAPSRMKELLMSQADLSIDLSARNVYILDIEGNILDGSDRRTSVQSTPNLLRSMNGKIGENSSIATTYMDLAVPIISGNHSRIVYIYDNKSTVNDLTYEVFTIILQSLALGLGICLALSILLAQILITPLRALTAGTRRVAAGNFGEELAVTSQDEIGDLTQNFNNMAQVLRRTLWEAENERVKLSTLFLHLTDGVIAFDILGKVIHNNPSATHMLQRPLDETCMFVDIFGEEADFSFLLALKTPHFLQGEKSVSNRQLELLMAPFSTETAQGGIMVVIHDVTEQRKSEQTRREFVANVSHELRTPLTNIKSYAETIVSAGDELPPELRENFLHVITGEADRMTHIVQDLLTLSKIDYGKMEMTITRFSFADAINQVSQAVSLDAKNHGHTFSTTIADSLPHVNGDRNRIEQVLMNILSNSIKYTPDGGHIQMTASHSGHFVILEVKDNGVGIPEADLPRLFERFYRVDKARSRESGGTGLGLSIAKDILNQHKGDISIESVYKEGTTVTIRLPTAGPEL